MWFNLQTLPNFNPQQEKISDLFGCINVYIWESMHTCTQIVCVCVCSWSRVAVCSENSEKEDTEEAKHRLRFDVCSRVTLLWTGCLTTTDASYMLAQHVSDNQSL